MKSGFVLDTNVISEARLARRNAGLDRWWTEVESSALFLSVVSLGEISRGIERVRPRDEVKAEGLENWLAELRHVFADRILPLREDVAVEWGRMSADRSRPVVDTMIAATAKAHGMTLVTRNIRDVEGLDVRVLNPFT